MKQRELKEVCYMEVLQESLVGVEKTLNQLKRLESNQGLIDKDIIEKDISKTILDLELSLASMCILLRKMSENKFITIPSDLRRDMNSIIHSNRFDYNGHIEAFSQKGKEEIELDELLMFTKEVLK